MVALALALLNQIEEADLSLGAGKFLEISARVQVTQI